MTATDRTGFAEAFEENKGKSDIKSHFADNFEDVFT
jgi:hypothetical protein